MSRAYANAKGGVAVAFADTSESLRAAISANPYMQVLVLNGYCER